MGGSLSNRALDVEGRASLISAGSIVLDEEARQAWVFGELALLTYLEFEVVRFFLVNPERVFTRAEVLRAVWPHQASMEERTVDVYVARIRRKMRYRLIQTVTKVGYRLAIGSTDLQESTRFNTTL